MKRTYHQKLDYVIGEIINNVKNEYKGDNKMLSYAVGITTILRTADPNENFIDGLLGFMRWAGDHDIARNAALATILHDLAEFRDNRHKAWFSPRTESYGNYVALEPHKGGFSMKDGHLTTREEELLILEENGYTIDKTNKGVFINK